MLVALIKFSSKMRVPRCGVVLKTLEGFIDSE